MAVRHATHNRVNGQQLWLDAICMVTTRKNLANVENDSAAARLRWGCVLKGGGALARVVVLPLDFTVVATEPDCVQDCEPHIGCAAKRQAGSRRFVLFCSRVWQMLLSSSSGKDEQMTLSHVIYAFDEQCWVHSIFVFLHVHKCLSTSWCSSSSTTCCSCPCYTCVTNVLFI